MTYRCMNEINKLLKPGETGSIWITNDDLAPECDWLLTTDRKYHKNMRFYKSNTIIDTYGGIELKNCPLGTFLDDPIFSEYEMSVIRKKPYVKYVDEVKITTNNNLLEFKVPDYLVITKHKPIPPHNFNFVTFFKKINYKGIF